MTWPPDRLAVLRRGELRASLAALGVDEHHLLGFADGECHLQDGTDAIAQLIDDIEPDLIVTFGPDGMTGHTDHRAVSRWTTAAWATTRPGADLWYATLTSDFHERWDPLNQHVGLWADQPEPPCVHPSEAAHNAALPDDLLDRKIAALRAHHSQTGPLIDLVGPGTYREWWRTESFRSARAADRASASLFARGASS